MITFIKSLFKPLYKVGDVLISVNSEFPDRYDFITITAVGKKQYQYCFGNRVNDHRHKLSVSYIDSYYELANPDIVKKTFGHR